MTALRYFTSGKVQVCTGLRRTALRVACDLDPLVYQNTLVTYLLAELEDPNNLS